MKRPDKSSSKPLTTMQFAKLAADGLRDAGQKSKLSYDTGEFCLRGQDDLTYYLNNAYAEYCSVPESKRAALMKQWVRGWLAARKSVPDDFEDAKPDLFPNKKQLAAIKGKS
jgi:hypothetical protein